MLLAWLGALCIGLALGILGSGGSIITVPVLVYLVGQPEKIAIAGSLAVVGAMSLYAAVRAGTAERRAGARYAVVGSGVEAGPTIRFTS